MTICHSNNGVGTTKHAVMVNSPRGDSIKTGAVSFCPFDKSFVIWKDVPITISVKIGSSMVDHDTGHLIGGDYLTYTVII